LEVLWTPTFADSSSPQTEEQLAPGKHLLHAEEAGQGQPCSSHVRDDPGPFSGHWGCGLPPAAAVRGCAGRVCRPQSRVGALAVCWGCSQGSSARPGQGRCSLGPEPKRAGARQEILTGASKEKGKEMLPLSAS